MNVGKEYDLPVLQTVDSEGKFINAVTPWRGMFVKDADPLITQDLEERGLMHKVKTYTHTYPFCWRCDTPLLYYAKTTWFIETSRVKDQLLANNEKINWYPEHIKNGRFGNWLSNNVDWALGRERYWGTPLPVWECDKCRHQEMIGSVAELKEKVGPQRAAKLDKLDLHRPYVDEVTFPCTQCGGTMKRVPEVIDCWFDSGAMPVAQWHYPFENKEMFIQNFPADYICEAVDQTRGWFYSLHAISTLLFDQPCYLNCLCLGLILDDEGQKMSKSRGNVVRPLGRAQRARGRRPALVPVYGQPAGQRATLLRRSGRRRGAQVHADLVEHLFVLRDLRQYRRVRSRPSTPAGQRALGAGPLGAGRAEPAGGQGGQGAGELRRDRRDAAHRGVRRRSEQLVRAAVAASFLEERRRHGQDRGLPDAV